MKNIINNKNIVAVVLVFLILATYTINKVGERQQDRAKEQAKKFKLINIEDNYEYCKTTASDVYDLNWEAQCTGQGKGTNCLLSGIPFITVTKTLEKAKEDCLDIYKAKLNTI